MFTGISFTSTRCSFLPPSSSLNTGAHIWTKSVVRWKPERSLLMLLRRFKIDFDVKMYKDLDPVGAMESQSGAVFLHTENSPQCAWPNSGIANKRYPLTAQKHVSCLPQSLATCYSRSRSSS